MIKNILLCFFFFIASVNAQGPQAAVKEGFITTENAQLFYRSIGKGQPIIVLHGGPGLSQDYLLPEFYKLAKNHRVIFYDQRACGRSSGEINENTINIERYVADLNAVRQALKFKKITILGHSWGGFLAMHYAIAHPEYVVKLILSNSMTASSEEFSLFIQEYMRRMGPYQKEMDAIHESKEFGEGNPKLMEKMYRMIFRTYCYNPDKANLLNLKMTPNAYTNGVKVNELFRNGVFLKPFNLHDSLKSLKIPTLIIHGDTDPIPPSTAENIHISIKDSQLVLMKNCGHFPYVEDSKAYFDHLEKFLNKKN